MRGSLHSFNRSVNRPKIFALLLLSSIISFVLVYNSIDITDTVSVIIEKSQNITKLEPEPSKEPEKPKEEEQPKETKEPKEPIESVEITIRVKPKPQNVITEPKKLYNTIFQLIKDADPKVAPFNRYKSGARIPNVGFNDNTKIQFSKEYLSEFLQLNETELEKMKESHSSIVPKFENITTKDIYKGDGIVFVGGGRFNWMALMSVKSLRNIGSELPVEVMIPNQADYEADLCENVLPSLNAKCLYLPEILGNETYSMLKFGGYQYKSLALLVSSFKNVLLLDADNLAAYVPDVIFRSEPFKSKGMIVWPDFWKRSTSPDFYNITGIEVSSDERVLPGFTENDKKYLPLHHMKGSLLDPTSESGQFILNKETHLHDMFLALYYNSYGPKYYYPLLSQGVVGEGDKETFLAASVALQNTYFQVRRSVHAVGRFKKDGHFVGVAMGQFDPIQDHLNSIAKTEDEKKGPRMLFVHSNFPKLHPVQLREQGKLFEGEERVRMFGPMKGLVGYDFELFQFRNMEHLLCDLRIELDTFKKENRTTMCEEIHQHVDFLVKHP